MRSRQACENSLRGIVTDASTYLTKIQRLMPPKEENNEVGIQHRALMVGDPYVFVNGGAPQLKLMDFN